MDLGRNTAAVQFYKSINQLKSLHECAGFLLYDITSHTSAAAIAKNINL